MQTKMDSEKKHLIVPEDIVRENYTLNKKNNSLKYIIGSISILLVILILIFTLSGETNYEKGMKYLHEKQYTEALFEFQKINPDEKDFKMAQSKINYIKGLEAYNKNVSAEALALLMKVDPSDQYYRESKLMIDNINMEDKSSILESLSQKVNEVRDTVIIKEQPVYTESESANDNNAKSSMANEYKLHLNDIQKQIVNFEDQYQSALTESDASMKISLKTLDSLYNNYTVAYTSGQSNVRIIEINNTVSSWMQKRIDLISELASDNSKDLTETARMIKEKGDKEYSKLIYLLNSMANLK